MLVGRMRFAIFFLLVFYRVSANREGRRVFEGGEEGGCVQSGVAGTSTFLLFFIFGVLLGVVVDG